MNEISQPKKWKFALLIWGFIYPLFTVLSFTLLPYLRDLPGPIQNLILSFILVPLMVWLYIPYVNKKCFVWLRK